MQKIKYGEPISVIVADRGYHQVVIRYLCERIELCRIGELWNARVDTSTLSRAQIESADNILDITAFDGGEPVAMGSIRIETGGARLELEPLAPPTTSINPPSRLARQVKRLTTRL